MSKKQELLARIEAKRIEADRLIAKLHRSIAIEETLEKHNVIPAWPIKTRFEGRVPDVYCSFKNIGIMLRLHYCDVPSILWPEQLTKDHEQWCKWNEGR